MTDLADLIARVEGASAGSDDLSRAVIDALGTRNANGTSLPCSTSLDAAVSLVERVLPGFLKGFREFDTFWRADLAGRHPGRKFSGWEAEGALPALALLAALLKAVQAQRSQHDARDGSPHSLHTGGGQSSPKPDVERSA